MKKDLKNIYILRVLVKEKEIVLGVLEKKRTRKKDRKMVDFKRWSKNHKMKYRLHSFTCISLLSLQFFNISIIYLRRFLKLNFQKLV